MKTRCLVMGGAIGAIFGFYLGNTIAERALVERIKNAAGMPIHIAHQRHVCVRGTRPFKLFEDENDAR